MKVSNEELAGMVAEDTAIPVRPVGVNGQKPWNAVAKRILEVLERDRGDSARHCAGGVDLKKRS